MGRRGKGAEAQRGKGIEAQSRAGWFCAAAVMALFGLQQVLPLHRFALMGTDRFPAALLHSLTCMFLHGHILHAALNALAFVCLLHGVKRAAWMPPLLGSLAAGWMATFLFGLMALPENAYLVGSSGILFGLLGWFTATEPKGRWSVLFVGSIPLVVLAPVFVALDAVTSIFFFPANAWPVHSGAFITGAAIALTHRIQISKDS